MWLHLLGKVSCPYGSGRLHIYFFFTPFSTALSLVRESLWFLLHVTDFYAAWMPVVPVKNLDPEAWHAAILLWPRVLWIHRPEVKVKRKKRRIYHEGCCERWEHILIMWEASGLIFINLRHSKWLPFDSPFWFSDLQSLSSSCPDIF